MVMTSGPVLRLGKEDLIDGALACSPGLGEAAGTVPEGT